MLRDFSDEKKAEILDAIDSAETSGFWSGVCDLFDDCFISDKISDYSDDIREYQRLIVDKKNTTREQLDTIFDAVHEIDARYAKKFIAYKDRLRDLIAKVSAAVDIMSGNVRRSTLQNLYGTGVSYDDVMNDPQKLAEARYNAKQLGLPFPLSAAQIGANDAAYYRILMLHSPTGIGVGGYNQLDWVNEEDANGKKFTAAFANVACYATCMLMIAQFYGHDVTMALLVKGGFVSGGGYGNATWPFYTEDRSFGNQGETANCQKIYEELLQNRPVVVALGVGNNTHFVVAVGMKPGATPPYTYDEITVMDPMAEYTLEERDKEPSHYWSLAEAIERKNQGVVDIRATTPGPGPDKEDAQ